MWMHRLSNASFVAAAGLFALAGYLYWFGPDERRVDIDEPEREISEARAGRTIEVAFPIHNPARETARVVGLGHC